MPFQMFHDLFPDLAERETRCVIALERMEGELPQGEYYFHEMFCNEKGCDCRRVFWYVVSSVRKDVETVIAWGWEEPAYYAKWLSSPDPHDVAELKGPILNMGSPHTAHAPAILEMARDLLLRDPDYVARIKRHYGLFRGKVDGKGEGKRKRSKGR